MSQQTQDRRWEIDLNADELGQPMDREFEEELHRELMKAGGILHRLGGALMVYTVREQDPETGLWHPAKAVFKWQSFVPGVRARTRREPEPEVEVEPEDEMVGPGVVAEVAEVTEARNTERAAQAVAVAQEGQLMQSPGGDAQEVVPFSEVQDRLRDGWKPVGGEDEEPGS